MPLLGGAEGAADAAGFANDLWSAKVRYIGVGAMVVGGAASIVAVRRGLVESIRTLAGSAEDAGAARGRDLPGGAIVALAVLAIALVAAIYVAVTGSFVVGGLSTATMVIAAFFFTAVASYIVGIVGNSNSPVSGMTITAVLFAGSVVWLTGTTGTDAIVATLGVTAVVCCVACTSGDVCNDLKGGRSSARSPGTWSPGARASACSSSGSTSG